MSSGDGMWCTFCIQSDTLNICNRPEWEDEYKFACDILGTLEDPTFTKIPLCDECLLSFRQLAVLRQQIIEVKKQLKERILNSEQIADKLKDNVGDEGQIMRIQVRTFRNGVLERGDRDDSLGKTTLNLKSLKKSKSTARRANKSPKGQGGQGGEDVVVKVEANYFDNGEDGDFFNPPTTPDDNCDDDNYNDFTGDGNNQEQEEAEEKKTRRGRKRRATSHTGKEVSSESESAEDSKTASSSSSRKKRTKPSKEELTCSHCSEIFESKRQLTTHLRQEHREKPERRSCPHCPYTSTSIKSCTNHILKDHPGEEEFRPFVCDKCGMSFKTNSHLRNHMRLHTRGTDKPFICHVCAFSTHTKGILTEHINNLHNSSWKKFQCYFCSMQFNKFNNVNQHMMKHTGEKPFKCEKCDFESTTVWNIKIHLKTVHKNDEEEGRVFQCPECSGKFKSQRSLLWHTKTIHTESLKCPIPGCLFEALTRSTLTQHVEDSHPKGEQNWPCTECPKKFQTQPNLQRHFRMHHQGDNSISVRAAQFSQSQQETTPTTGYFTPFSTFQLPSGLSYQHPNNPPPNQQYQQHEELLTHFVWPQ